MSPLSSSRIDLPLTKRWLFLAICALIALAGSAEAIKIAAAAQLLDSTKIEDVKRGLKLDPDNPELHNHLSQLYGDTLETSNPDEQVKQARQATELNPHKSEYWLTLASACETIRDHACADDALQHALVLSPKAPFVWWVAGNQYLRTDRQGAAISCFRHLLELSPAYATPVFDLTLHAYDDPKLTLENIVGGGKDPGLALAYADFLSANNDFDNAYLAWTETVGRNSEVSFRGVRPYLERLMNNGRYQEAQSVWEYLEGRGIIANPGDRETGNAVFNPGFEQLPLGAGFDWISQPSPYVSVDFTDSSSFEGKHCLRVDFPVAQNDEFEPVYQILSVAPSRAYILTGQVRSSDILSTSGPQLRVIDPACPSCLNASTEPTVGSTPWHAITLNFKTGPQTQAVRISVWRPRSRAFPMDISGTFWLDAVKVQADRR